MIIWFVYPEAFILVCWFIIILSSFTFHFIAFHLLCSIPVNFVFCVFSNILLLIKKKEKKKKKKKKKEVKIVPFLFFGGGGGGGFMSNIWVKVLIKIKINHHLLWSFLVVKKQKQFFFNSVNSFYVCCCFVLFCTFAFVLKSYFYSSCLIWLQQTIHIISYKLCSVASI